MRERLRLRINRTGLRIYGGRLSIYRGRLVVRGRRRIIIRRRRIIIRRRPYIHAIWVGITVRVRMIDRDAKTNADAYPSGLERGAGKGQNGQ